MMRPAHALRQLSVEQLELRRLLAADYLLKLDGIPGESSDLQHPGAIEISSFSWGASSQAVPGPVDPRIVEEFRFVTDVSTASPALFAAAAKGTHIKQATLFVRQPGNPQADYLKVSFSDILVSSYQTRSLNEGLPQEEIALTFSKIRQEYQPTNADGSLAAPIVTAWDVSQKHIKIDSAPSLFSGIPSSNVDQTDAFLEISGIQGDSPDAKHKESIQIESWSWGLSQSQVSGGGSGKVSLQDFHFAIRNGKASPAIATALTTGKRLTDAVLFVRRAGSSNDADYLKIKMTDILISSYQATGSSSSAAMDEFAFNFSKISQQVSATQADGRVAPIAAAAWTASPGKFTPVQGESILDDTLPIPGKSELFLQISGIPGAPVDHKDRDLIAIDSFSWGLSQQPSNSSGARGKVSYSDLSITMSSGNATPQAIQSVVKGKHFADAKLTARTSGSDTPYLKYELADILISSFQTSSLNESLPTDSVSLNFTKIKWDYQAQKEDGSVGAPVGFSWTAPPSATRIANSIPFVRSPSPTEGAVEYFLKIENIPGEAVDHKDRDWINLESFSWGVSQSSSSRGGRATMQDFHFVAPVSQASPLIAAAVTSDSLPRGADATLMIRRAGASDYYLKYELKDLLVSTYSVRSIDSGVPMEEFTLRFEDLDIAAQTTSSSGRLETTAAAFDGSSRDLHVVGPSILDATKTEPGAVAMFLGISGIAGDSAVPDHKDKTDLLSFSWGVSHPTASSGGGSGKVSMQDFHFAMKSSSATPALLSAGALGTRIPEIELSVARTGTDRPYVFVKYSMKEVIVSSYQTQGSQGNAPLEEISVNFTGLEHSVSPPSFDGTAPSPVSFSWSNSADPAIYEQGASILSETSPQPAAANYLLKIQGIDGESTEKDHKGWIDVLSFSWGMSRTITSRSPGRIGALHWDDFSFEADVSRASPPVLSALATGKHFPGAELSISNSDRKERLTYKLSDVFVSSYGLSTSEGAPTDQFSLAPAALKVSYQDLSRRASTGFALSHAERAQVIAAAADEMLEVDRSISDALASDFAIADALRRRAKSL